MTNILNKSKNQLALRDLSNFSHLEVNKTSFIKKHRKLQKPGK